MRPGHFCPGNMYREAQDLENATSFNEAGAFLPRKPSSTSRLSSASLRFNEAGAFLPRKHSETGDLVTWN